jgi:galactarate dehydratase
MNEIARPIPLDPLTIRMHERDNVAIVANNGGLPKGTVLSSGVTLREHVPQGHKVALADLSAEDPVQRYNVNSASESPAASVRPRSSCRS